MIIRLIRLAIGSATPAPTIALRVGDGPMTAIALSGATSLTASSDPAAPIVADVDIPSVTDDVYTIEVLGRDGRQAPTFDWALQLTNNDPVGRAFRWVVADSAADSRQALITVAATTTLETVPGQQVTGTVQVGNRGTGDLTITTPVPSDLGSGFTLTAVPRPIIPNADDRLTITYRPPADLPGEGSAADHGASSRLVRPRRRRQRQRADGHRRYRRLPASTAGHGRRPTASALTYEPEEGRP
jgi:hypothetical protein